MLSDLLVPDTVDYESHDVRRVEPEALQRNTHPPQIRDPRARRQVRQRCPMQYLQGRLGSQRSLSDSKAKFTKRRTTDNAF